MYGIFLNSNSNTPEFKFDFLIHSGGLWCSKVITEAL